MPAADAPGRARLLLAVRGREGGGRVVSRRRGLQQLQGRLGPPRISSLRLRRRLPLPQAEADGRHALPTKAEGQICRPSFR